MITSLCRRHGDAMVSPTSRVRKRVNGRNGERCDESMVDEGGELAASLQPIGCCGRLGLPCRGRLHTTAHGLDGRHGDNGTVKCRRVCCLSPLRRLQHGCWSSVTDRADGGPAGQGLVHQLRQQQGHRPPAHATRQNGGPANATAGRRTRTALYRQVPGNPANSDAHTDTCTYGDANSGANGNSGTVPFPQSQHDAHAASESSSR